VVAAKDTNDAVSSRKMEPDHGPDTARFPMEAGITGGVSLLFGGFNDGQRATRDAILHANTKRRVLKQRILVYDGVGTTRRGDRGTAEDEAHGRVEIPPEHSRREETR
jgi:hypothetical protein